MLSARQISTDQLKPLTQRHYMDNWRDFRDSSEKDSAELVISLGGFDAIAVGINAQTGPSMQHSRQGDRFPLVLDTLMLAGGSDVRLDRPLNHTMSEVTKTALRGVMGLDSVSYISGTFFRRGMSRFIVDMELIPLGLYVQAVRTERAADMPLGLATAHDIHDVHTAGIEVVPPAPVFYLER